MFDVVCKKFICDKEKVCILFDTCEECKIKNCEICVLKKTCTKYKEKKKNESKI